MKKGRLPDEGNRPPKPLAKSPAAPSVPPSSADRAAAWTLIVSKEPSGFHTQYHERADLGRAPLTKSRLDTPVERLTFALVSTSPDSGAIEMTWETTKVAVPVSVRR